MTEPELVDEVGRPRASLLRAVVRPAVAGRPSRPAWEQAERRPPTTMLRAAVRPRMLVILVLLLAGGRRCAPASASWQLDRAQVRGASAEERHTAAAGRRAPPSRSTTVLQPQTSFTGPLVGRKVAVTGTYDAAGQLLVPDRAHDGTIGLPRPDAADASRRRSRRAARSCAAGSRRPPTPTSRRPGTVDVVGYLQASEAGGVRGRRRADRGDQLGRAAERLGRAHLHRVPGRGVVRSRAVASVALLDPPTKPGSGLNIQNLAYAAQWWIFGAFAVLLWLRLVRDEARGALGRTTTPEPATRTCLTPRVARQACGGR